MTSTRKLSSTIYICVLDKSIVPLQPEKAYDVFRSGQIWLLATTKKNAKKQPRQTAVLNARRSMREHPIALIATQQ